MRFVIIIMAIVLSACSSKIQCPDAEAADKAGYDRAISEINIENAKYLRGEMLACKVFQFTPHAVQNILSLDCTRPWETYPNIDVVSAKMPVMPVVFAILWTIIVVMLISLLIQPLGHISGQWNAAIRDRYGSLRSKKIAEAEAEAKHINETRITPLKRQEQSLLSAIEKAKEALRISQNLASEAEEKAAELENEMKTLERQVALGKTAESTNELADILANLGRNPKPR